MIVRLFERLTGIDAVRYWRERHEGTLELLKSTVETSRKAMAEAEKTVRDLTDATIKAKQQAADMGATARRLERELAFERTARSLYEQVVSEAGQQIEKNQEVAPKTMLGVLRVALAEAIGTVEAWRQGAPVETAMSTTLRATLANRLLPDPKPGKLLPGQGQRISTERNRTGKAGDSASSPRPDQPHVFEYGPFNITSGPCMLCQKPLTDPIHSPSLGWSAPASPEEFHDF